MCFVLLDSIKANEIKQGVQKCINMLEIAKDSNMESSSKNDFIKKFVTKDYNDNSKANLDSIKLCLENATNTSFSKENLLILNEDSMDRIERLCGEKPTGFNEYEYCLKRAKGGECKDPTIKNNVRDYNECINNAASHVYNYNTTYYDNEHKIKQENIAKSYTLSDLYINFAKDNCLVINDFRASIYGFDKQNFENVLDSMDIINSSKFESWSKPLFKYVEKGKMNVNESQDYTCPMGRGGFNINYIIFKNNGMAKNLQNADSIKLTYHSNTSHCSMDAGINTTYFVKSFSDKDRIYILELMLTNGWNGWCRG